MGWLDRVPQAGNLFIGGQYAIYQTEEVQRENITHVVSVIERTLSPADYAAYKHLVIKLEDDWNENLLEHFGRSNEFIAQGLEDNGAVFVHCAMGVSRSATVVVAYLMQKYRLSPPEALAQLNEGRPVCRPNPGFQEQLEVYHRMLQASNKTVADEIYQKWHAGRVWRPVFAWQQQRKDLKHLL